MSQWYYAADGQPGAPVSEEQLRQMIVSGQLRPTVLIWKEGMAEWKPANTVAELTGGVASSASGTQPAYTSYPSAGAPQRVAPLGYATPGAREAVVATPMALEF